MNTYKVSLASLVEKSTVYEHMPIPVQGFLRESIIFTFVCDIILLLIGYLVLPYLSNIQYSVFGNFNVGDICRPIIIAIINIYAVSLPIVYSSLIFCGIAAIYCVLNDSRLPIGKQILAWLGCVLSIGTFLSFAITILGALSVIVITILCAIIYILLIAILIVVIFAILAAVLGGGS